MKITYKLTDGYRGQEVFARGKGEAGADSYVWIMGDAHDDNSVCLKSLGDGRYSDGDGHTYYELWLEKWVDGEFEEVIQNLGFFEA